MFSLAGKCQVYAASVLHTLGGGGGGSFRNSAISEVDSMKTLAILNCKGWAAIGTERCGCTSTISVLLNLLGF